jgi:hypothetical protein
MLHPRHPRSCDGRPLGGLRLMIIRPQRRDPPPVDGILGNV